MDLFKLNQQVMLKLSKMLRPPKLKLTSPTQMLKLTLLKQSPKVKKLTNQESQLPRKITLPDLRVLSTAQISTKDLL